MFLRILQKQLSASLFNEFLDLFEVYCRLLFCENTGKEIHKTIVVLWLAYVASLEMRWFRGATMKGTPE